ncbi:hypothetical protein HHI36_011118 [Cryptolaemus montrouzieri]|uniref:Uncharacterized protein n=1 Tax=Cryptolaemus montrouzieri TaxID=559131 RepID=A0ABD2MKW8_9CUCU
MFQIIPIIGIIGHSYQDIKGKHIGELVYCIYALNFLTMDMLHVSIFLKRGEKFLNLFEGLSDFQRGIPKNYAITVEAVEKTIKLICCGTFLIAMTSVLECYIDDYFCSNKEIDDKHYICGMLAPAWFPIEINFSMSKPIFAIYYSTTYIIYAPIGVTLFFLNYGCVKMIILRIDHLKDYLRQIDFNENADQVGEKFTFCVKYYAEINWYV